MKNTERNRNIYSKLIIFMSDNQAIEAINNMRTVCNLFCIAAANGYLFFDNRGLRA